MKVLELFAGTRSIGKAFEAKGHEVYSVEWNKDFENINLYADISKLTSEQILKDFGHPDVIWASPDCTSFSVAAISYHRRLNKLTGNLDPITDYAKFCDECDQHVLQLIKELNPTYWFIENPRGGMRSMIWMRDLPRYTVTYCFDGNEKFITDKGHKTFAECCDEDVNVLNINGDWEHAVVRNYGAAELYKITLSRARKNKVIYTTKNHKWIAAMPTNKYSYGEYETKDLKKGMLFPYAIPYKSKKDTKFQPRRWSVVSVESTGIIKDVYCCETDKTHTFTLEDNIVTHNCKYGDTRMKPTDIWTNHPNPRFIAPCKNGDPCHVAAPRGSRTGTQGLKGARERSIIPQKLCEHIVEICENPESDGFDNISLF